MICQSFRQTYSIKAFSVLQLISKMQWHFRRIILKTLTREQQITRQDVPVLPRVSGFSKNLSSVIDLSSRNSKSSWIAMSSFTSFTHVSWKQMKDSKLSDRSDYVAHVMTYSRVSVKRNYYFSEICLYVFMITENYANRFWWYRTRVL